MASTGGDFVGCGAGAWALLVATSASLAVAGVAPSVRVGTGIRAHPLAGSVCRSSASPATCSLPFLRRHRWIRRSVRPGEAGEIDNYRRPRMRAPGGDYDEG